MAKYVVGVDGGTGGIRAGLFEIATGTPVGFADTPYETTYPRPGWAEQDPNDWWAGMGSSVRKVLADTGVAASDVAGICCDTTCCTVVALDDAGDPLMPCILWMDMRAAEQTKQVLATGDVALRVNSDGAGPVSAEWMVPKALWLKQHRPELFAQAAKSVRVPGLRQPQAHRAVLRIRQQRRRAMALRRRTTPASLLDKLGMPELAEKWPKDVVQMGHTVAPLSGAAAEHLGLTPGIPVAQGGADAFVAMVGPRNRPPRSARAHHRVLAPAPGRDRGSVPRAGDLGDLLRGARR